MAGALLGAALACSRGAGSPEEAFGQFHSAVTSRDARRLFAALDLETRWSWMSIRRAQREAYDVVSTAFPESVRAQQLVRFRAAAESGSEADLFHLAFDPKTWDELARGLPASSPPLERPGPTEAIAHTTDGRALPFRLGARPKEGWGFAGLAAAAEERKRRAAGDLEFVKASAADYERAQGSR